MWIDIIRNYHSDIEQEMVDRELILEAYNLFGDSLLSRDNKFMHMSSSSMILNENKDKVLMAYHNIYKSYSWTGGHNDGDEDFLKVAIKEAKEETGVNDLKLLKDGVASIEILEVCSHFKRGKYVNPHLHLNVSYLFTTYEDQNLHIKEDENSSVKWIEIDELDKYVSLNDINMLGIYRKLLRDYI